MQAFGLPLRALPPLSSLLLGAFPLQLFAAHLPSFLLQSLYPSLSCSHTYARSPACNLLHLVLCSSPAGWRCLFKGAWRVADVGGRVHRRAGRGEEGLREND